jgi:hypothetical protein
MALLGLAYIFRALFAVQLPPNTLAYIVAVTSPKSRLLQGHIRFASTEALVLGRGHRQFATTHILRGLPEEVYIFRQLSVPLLVLERQDLLQ